MPGEPVVAVSESRYDEVWALVSAEATMPADKPEVFGWLQRLCRAAVRSLPATGVGLSLMSDDGAPTAVAASDPGSELIEDLQFTLGEGPCLAAYASGGPVLTADLTEAARTRWPVYAPAAREQGVHAVFAFPMQIGAACLGVLDVYRDRVGELSGPTLSRAMTFADVAMRSLLDAQQLTGDADVPPGLEDAMGSRLEVYQAQGMVAVQLKVSLREAMVRLRAYAYAHDRRLSDVAVDVVARRISLEADEA
jgi:GAF domain/ANTAR domain